MLYMDGNSGIEKFNLAYLNLKKKWTQTAHTDLKKIQRIFMIISVFKHSFLPHSSEEI